MSSNNIIIPIGLRIRNRREYLHMDVARAAKEVGFSAKDWIKIEAGQKVLKAERVHAIAEVLEMDAQELMDGQKEAGEFNLVELSTGDKVGAIQYIRQEHKRGGGIFGMRLVGYGKAAIKTGEHQGAIDLAGYTTKKVIETKIARNDEAPMMVYRDSTRSDRWYAVEDIATTN